MKFPLDWLLLNKWLWFTVLGCWAVMIGPFIVITVMMHLPAPIKMAGLFGLLVGYGVASGYKDWIQARKREQQLHPEEYQF